MVGITSVTLRILLHVNTVGGKIWLEAATSNATPDVHIV